MLEFTQVFNKGHMLKITNICTILKCKNIEFDHVYWETKIFGDVELMQHIIDNIVDINVREYYNGASYTLLQNIIRLISPYYGYNNSTLITTINYALNNGHISVRGFDGIRSDDTKIVARMSKFRNFVNYLTTISLNRFTKFYNIQSYYDTCKTILLIIKVQSIGNIKQSNHRLSKGGVLTSLPSTVIKHLIIPFVYQ